MTDNPDARTAAALTSPLGPVPASGPAGLDQGRSGRGTPWSRRAPGRWRETLATAGRQIRDETARPLGRLEKVLLAAILLAPVAFNAVTLLSELTVPVPSVNDDMLHWLFVQRASEALSQGQNVFDHWLPQIELGVAQFFYYQHLPHLAVVLVERVSFGALDLFTSFNLIRYLLLIAFPLTVFWSMRRMGFSAAASAIAGASSALLSSDFRYGFEYDSYTWRGFGLYTQLWGMHLSFITLACMVRLIRTGRGAMWAVLAFSLLALSHLIYAYMMAITLLVLFLFGLNQANVVPRFVRIGVVVVLTGLIASYMVVPFALGTEFLNASPYLQPEKYDSYGFVRVAGWLVSGDLLDHARLPVMSLLLLVGIVGALLGRMRPALLAVVLLVVWVVIYAGRPALGPIADLFPFSDGLLFHRFIGGVHLAAIMLIGVGGAVIWQLFAPHRAVWQTLAAAFVVSALLLPAYAERAQFNDLNDQWMRRSMAAIEADQDASAILATLETLPPGRVYAGLPATYGDTMRFADVKFYNLLPFEGLEGMPPPSESFSLNADFIWDFHENDQIDYELFNARYVIAPAALVLPDFLRVIRETPTYTLYEAPSGGYAMYGTLVARQAFESQRDLFVNNRDWFRGRTLPENRQFIRYDYPATTAGPLPTAGPCLDGEVSFELFQPGRMDFVVGCSTDATLILKTTYHPNWVVSVDGQAVDSYMVSPSLIGIDIPAGRHAVTAEYRPDPLKLPLLLLGLATVLIAVIAGPKLDDGVAALVGRLPQPRFVFPPMPWSARRRRPGTEPALVEPALVEPALVEPALAGLSPALPVPAQPVPVEPVVEPPAVPPVAPAREPASSPPGTTVLAVGAAASMGRLASSVRARFRSTPRPTERSKPSPARTVAAATALGSARSSRRTDRERGAHVAASPAPPWRTRLRGAFADGRAALPVLAVAVVTILLYVLVYLAQRAISLDGGQSSLNPKNPGQVEGELRLYYVATVALFGLYAAVVVLAWRRSSIGGLTRTLLLATPVVVQVGLMVDRPYLSTDVLSYLAHGYVGIARGVGNAYSELSRGVLGTNLGDQLVALGWRPPPLPSPYGPLWTDLEGAVMAVTNRVPVAILAFKLVATLASLGSIALVWRILGHVQPNRQLLGTVLFAWNPVVIVELAGEGHNDALMLFFALAGVLATVRMRPAATLVATTLGTLTKYVPILILPPQLVYLWRARTGDRTFVNTVALGGMASLVLAVVLFAPVWSGLQTFAGVGAAGEPGPWPTVSGALFRFLERSRPGLDAGAVVRLIVQGLFLAFVVVQSLRVRTVRDMLEAAARIALAYLLFGSPVYFPWYAVFPVALLALVPRFGTVVLIFVISVMSRAIAPLVDLRPEYNPFPIAAFQVTNAGILIGLFVFIAMLTWAFLGWAAGDDRDPRPDGMGDLEWFLLRFDRRVALPAFARRRFGLAVPVVASDLPTVDVMSPEEIEARTAPPAHRFERPVLPPPTAPVGADPPGESPASEPGSAAARPAPPPPAEPAPPPRRRGLRRLG